MKFKCIVMDESHYLKNHKSNRTKAVKQLAKNIKYRFALSGTPMINRPRELISQLDIIDRLETMGGFWTYAKQYCDAKETRFGWDMGGFSNIVELHDKLINSCFIRRLKSDVLDELPEKQRTEIPLMIDNMSEYMEAKLNFVKWVKTNVISEEEFKEQIDENTLLTKSQKNMVIKAKMQLKLDGIQQAEAMVQLEYLKQISAKGKLNKFKEWADNIIDSGEKIVIFAHHQEIYKELLKYYKDNCVSIVGGMTAKKKDEAVEQFQTNDKIRVFIGALDAAGVGITLTASSTVAFVEFGWTSAIHDQAEDRCHRMGQKNFTNIYYFYGKDTVDEHILELIKEKRELSGAILDGKKIKMEETEDLKKLINKFL